MSEERPKSSESRWTATGAGDLLKVGDGVDEGVGDDEEHDAKGETLSIDVCN